MQMGKKMQTVPCVVNLQPRWSPDKAMFGVRLHQQPCPLHKADWAKPSQADTTHSRICSCNPDSTRSCRGSCQVNGIFGALAVINDGRHGQYGARCSRCAELLWYLWLISICISACSLLPAVVQIGQQQHVAIFHSLPQTLSCTALLAAAAAAAAAASMH